MKATGGTASIASRDTRAVAYGLSGTNTISGNGTINVTATGGKVTGSDSEKNSSATAAGLWAMASTNRIDGNVDITADASVKQASAEFTAYSLAAFSNVELSDKGGNNDLSSIGKLKMLRGDVFATSDASIRGVNTLVLDTKGSYLQGNIISGKAYYGGSGPYGTNYITISNDAIWRPVYDNSYGTDCAVDKDGKLKYDSKKKALLWCPQSFLP